MSIGIIGHNSVEYVELLLSIWNSGNSVGFVDSDAPPSAIMIIIEESKVERCYAGEPLCFCHENPTLYEHITKYIEYKMPCIFRRRYVLSEESNTKKRALILMY